MSQSFFLSFFTSYKLLHNKTDHTFYVYYNEVLSRSIEVVVVVFVVFCFSFHVGSLCMNPASYQDAVELAYKVFQYAESVGYHMSLLDIGGGYHGGKDEQYRVLFDKTAKHIQKGLEKFGGVRDLKVIAEPG